MSGRLRRATVHGPFAGLYERSDLYDDVKLVALGSACAVVEDEHAHAGVEQCLVQHPQDSQLLLDRFDGRNLLGLHEINACEAEWGSKPGEAADLHSLEPGFTLADLNNERYGDLDPSREHLLQDPFGFTEYANSRQHQDAQQDQRQSPGPGGAPHQGPAFAFDYGTAQPAGQQQGLVDDTRYKPPPLLPLEDDTGSGHQQAGAAFQPPFDNIPPHLSCHLPPTERQHQIISQTAKFVRTNGSQVEVLLRVKHGGNPNFAFLIPQDRLFPYYSWLVDEAPQELPREQPAAAASTGPGEAANAAARRPGTEQEQQQQGGLSSHHVEQEQQPQDVTAAAAAASPIAGDAGGMGALDLLRAYSMASEHESEHEGADSRQQEVPDSVTPASEGAPDVGAGEEGAVDVDAGEEGSAAGVCGPELPAMLGSSSPAEDAAQQLPQAAVVPATAADGGVGTSKAVVAAEHAVDAAAGAAINAVEASPVDASASTSDAAAVEPAAATAAAAAAAGSGTAEPSSDDTAEPAAPGTGEQLADVPDVPDVPPAQLKGIIDKLVAFVKKNGIKFELVVRTREHSNPRFAFLHPSGPHHAYYRRQLELAMGPEPVAQLFLDMQPAQPAGPSSDSRGTGTAAEVSKPAQKLMALKANPRLVLAQKRSTPAQAPAAEAQQHGANAETQAADSPEGHTVQKAREAEPAAGTLATGPGGAPSGADASASAAAAAAAAATAAALVAAATAPARTTSAAEPVDPATALAKKRLKLQMYLKQKRAEQLAEKEQQEQEKKARAILAHRMLLKRLAAAGGEGEAAAHSEGGHEQQGLDAGPAAVCVPVQPPEVEEGEIEETDEIDEIAEGSAAKAAADATASAEKERSEVQQLLQPEGPVITTLPGLKELAGSAAAAATAAKHRAALLAGSDDEQEAAGDEPGSTAVLAAALKARLAAVKKSRFDTGPPAPRASTEGAPAVTVGPAASAAAPAPSVAGSSSVAVNMVAAANAAAAVIAAQAAGVPAATMLPVPVSLPLQLPSQTQLQPVVPALAPDSELAAALAAAAASAAAAAAVQPKAGGKQVATSSSTSSHSKDTHSGSSEDDAQPRSRASRSPSTPGGSLSRSSSKPSRSGSRSRSSSGEGSSSRSSSESPVHCRSKPRAKLRRGDTAQRKRSRSQSRSHSRHDSPHRKRTRSSSRHRRHHKHGSSRQHRQHRKRDRSASSHRSRSTDDRRQRRKHKHSRSKHRSGRKKEQSSRRRSKHSRKGRRERSRTRSPTVSRNSSSSDHGGRTSQSPSIKSGLPAPAWPSASAAAATSVPISDTAAATGNDSSKAGVAPNPPTGAGLPSVPVDSDKLRQRLRQMLEKLQK